MAAARQLRDVRLQLLTLQGPFGPPAGAFPCLQPRRTFSSGLPLATTVSLGVFHSGFAMLLLQTRSGSPGHAPGIMVAGRTFVNQADPGCVEHAGDRGSIGRVKRADQTCVN